MIGRNGEQVCGRPFRPEVWPGVDADADVPALSLRDNHCGGLDGGDVCVGSGFQADFKAPFGRLITNAAEFLDGVIFELVGV